MKTIFALNCVCLAVAVSVLGCSKAKKAGPPALPPSSQVIGTDATNDPITLRLNWIAAKKYGFRLEAVQVMDVAMGDQAPKKTVLALTHEYSVNVPKPLPGGGNGLDVELTGQKFFYQWNDRNWLNFDSRQDKSYDSRDPVSPLLRKLQNAPVRLVTDTDGKMLRVEGLAALTHRLDKGDASTRASLLSALTEENIRQVFDDIANAQPADAKKVGDSWPVKLEFDVSGMATAVVDAHCKVAGWETECERQCVRIDVDGSISFKPGSGLGDLAKIENGTISGTAWFDPALGMVVMGSSQEHATIKAEALGQSVSTRMNVTSNLRLVSVEAD